MKLLLLLAQLGGFVVLGFYILFIYTVDNAVQMSAQICILFLSLLSQTSVCSYLFIFGCCVSHCKNKTKKALLLNFNFDKSDNSILNIIEETKCFANLKESLSFGLLSIFSSLTIICIFMVFTTIRSFFAYDSATMMICNATWCANLCFILIYLAVVADQVDQLRMETIHKLW